MDGVADKDGQAELGIQLAKGQHRALDDPRLHRQPGGNRLDEQAVGDALAEMCIRDRYWVMNWFQMGAASR